MRRDEMTQKRSSKIVSVILSLLLFIGCTQSVRPDPPLQAPPSPSNGLLVGGIHWRQAGREVVRLGPAGSVTRIVVQNDLTHQYYSIDLTGPYFHIPLPPGRYRLVGASVSNAEVERLEPNKAVVFTFTAAVIIVLLSVSVLAGGSGSPGPLLGGGSHSVTPPKGDFSVDISRHRYAPVDIKEKEATFIGALTIDAPKRPSNLFFLLSNFVSDKELFEVTVSEEGEAEMLKELEIQFPHIKKIEKRLLAKN